MIADRLSLFGFDLFGIAKRGKAVVDKQTAPVAGNSASSADRRSENRTDDREYTEAFFWGVHPFY
ncbi:hypothetical protein [Neorhizobium alkalisoli]|uniref:Uncharacterized protein n=1 Tax=Neorhizobium alkalisoli TaxID=528178 RepID=A0A561R8Q2_9HYPH|nr:hypothetical protein [Neorhizobium alkalisoli]TWF58957.1 hypothetical protein FHW37_101761 [Neorhizobium alkalisoli]